MLIIKKMDVKLIIFEIYPPLSDISTHNEELIMTIMTETSERFINVGESLSNPKGFSFKAKDNVIKCRLFKGEKPYGKGEFQVNNEMHWIAIRNTTEKLQTEVRLRIKCSVIDDLSSTQTNASIKNASTPYSLSNDINYDQVKPYLKPKIGKLFLNKSGDSTLTNLTTAKVNSSRQTNTSVKEDIVMQQFKTQRGEHSLCVSSSNGNIDYSLRTAQKQIRSNSSYAPFKDKAALEEQIIDKAYENNIKKDEMIMNSTKPNDDCDEMIVMPLDEIESHVKAFEDKKVDFILLYEDNLQLEVSKETLLFEAELFIEKYSELQFKYHQAIKLIKEHLSYYKTLIKEMHYSNMLLIKMKSELDLVSLRNDQREIANNKMVTLSSELRLSNEEMKLWSKIMVKDNLKRNQTKVMKEKLAKALLTDVILTVFTKPKNISFLEKLNVYQRCFVEKTLHNESNGFSICHSQRAPIITFNKQSEIPVKTKLSPLLNTKPNKKQSSSDYQMTTSSNKLHTKAK